MNVFQMISPPDFVSDLAIPSRLPTQLPRYNQFMRLAVLASLLLSLLTILPAQEKPKSALDKTRMEAYVRHLLAVLPEVQVKIDDPKPSGTSELQEVAVHFTYRPLAG